MRSGVRNMPVYGWMQKNALPGVPGIEKLLRFCVHFKKIWIYLKNMLDKACFCAYNSTR